MRRRVPSPHIFALLCLLAAPAWGQVGSIAPPGQNPPNIRGLKVDYYPVNIADWHGQFEIQLTQQSGNDADLYLRFGAKPTAQEWDHRSRTLGTSNESIVITTASAPPLQSGTWWIAVRHSATTSYGISYFGSTLASLRPGMGATPYVDGGESGTTFRVWAPNATEVHLAGDFNGWSNWQAALVSEGNGNWSFDVRNLGHGAKYQFVLRNGNNELWKNDPRAKALTNSVGDSLIVDASNYSWSGTPFNMPAWNDLIIYELHIGTFFDSPGGPVGTFTSAIAKLDDLADLGINLIHVMPISEFAGDYSWGYNYGHPFSVESAYGGVDGFKSFIDQAHQRGIGVIVDVVYNHWGPTDMDLWQFDGWSTGGWGGIYFYNDARAQTPWGDTRPDYGRNEVRSYIRDNVMQWLEEYQADGLRWDSTSFMRNGPWGDIPEAWSLMQWINDEINAAMGWKISIAEDMWNNNWITKTTGTGGAGFDSQWDAQFIHPIRAALEAPDDNNRNMWAVRDAIAANYNGDAFQRVVYTESHDEVANGRSRVPESIWPGNADSWYSKKRSTLGAAIALTSPGIPMLFQGQEFLEDGFFADTDPVDWGKRTTYAGIRNLYRDLIQLRRNWFNTTRGLRGQGTQVHHVNDNDKMIAYHRWDTGGAGDDVIVVCNFANRSWSNYRVGFPRTGTWKVRFNSDYAGYDAFFGGFPTTDVVASSALPWDGMPASADLSIGPYTVVIFSQ
jgi:1,4-alpha-glucan branching enzyme